MSSDAVVSPQQVKFFTTFGYLRFPGLFAAEIAEIEAAFESVWADPEHFRMDMDVELHRNDPRTIIPNFIDKHPRLLSLKDDPRIRSIVDALLPDGHVYAESDGNLASCDSEWHADTYGAPMEIRHVKLSFYLDRLREDSGAIRLIPGTHFWSGPFARGLRHEFRNYGQTLETFGVECESIPSVVLHSDPGDVLVWDYRTIHASFNGQDRRRFFSVNFKELVADSDAGSSLEAVGASS